MPDKSTKIKKAGKIISQIIGYIILAFLITLIFVSAFSKISGNNASLFGIGFYKVVTGSMEPQIMTGEMVITRKVKQEKLEVGDVVTFRQSNKIITHRIISIDGNKITTQGDANINPDTPITYNDITGRVFFHSVLLGKVFDFLTGTLGFFFVIILPLLIFAGYEVYQLLNNIDKYRNEKKALAAQSTTKEKEIETEPEKSEAETEDLIEETKNSEDLIEETKETESDS